MNDDVSTELLSAYLDGELSSDEQQSVEQKLSASPAAQQTLEQLRAVAGSLQSLPRASAPAGIKSRIMERVEQARREQLLNALAPPVDEQEAAAAQTQAGTEPLADQLQPANRLAAVSGQQAGAPQPPPVAQPGISPNGEAQPTLAQRHSERQRGDRRRIALLALAIASAAAVLVAVMMLVGSEDSDPVAVGPQPAVSQDRPKAATNSDRTEGPFEFPADTEVATVESNVVEAPHDPPPQTGSSAAETSAKPPVDRTAATDPPAVPPKESPGATSPAAKVTRSAVQAQTKAPTVAAPRTGPFSERPDIPAAMIAVIDVNGDGRISDRETQHAVAAYQRLAEARRKTEVGKLILERFDKNEDQKLDDDEAQTGVVRARRSFGARGKAVADLCNSIDADADGLLTLQEFAKLAERLGAGGLELRARADKLFEDVDRDGGGGISFAEAQLYADAFIERSGLVVGNALDPSELLPSEDALATVKRTMKMLDRNNDEQISRRESRNDPKLRLVFDEVDLDQDALVTEGEMFTYLRLRLPAEETPKSFNFRITRRG